MHATGQIVPSRQFEVVSIHTQMDKVVIDNTKISGTFDFGLTWTPDLRQTSESGGPSIFTAIREQYGLELKSSRGSVEVTVIDQIERPVDN